MGRKRPRHERPIIYEYKRLHPRSADSPKTSAGIVIELLFREDTSDEWPDALIQALAEIVQTDPVNDLDSIRLRVTSKYDEAAAEVVPKWEFLNFEGEPLAGRAATDRGSGPAGLGWPRTPQTLSSKSFINWSRGNNASGPRHSVAAVRP